MSDRKRPPAWFEAEDHPVAWFAALARAVDKGDQSLIDRAQDELERLGYFVVPLTPPEATGRGVDR